ncbi:MAG TPA: hypothetical protein VFQ40_09770 [Actinomycetota bacterium]|nr:hypothetical protein [Actinomycetota bacterium]
MSSRIRALGRWLAVTSLGLLLAGCVRVDMELEVSPENTVTGSAVLAVDDSLLELTGQSADELFRGIDTTTTDLPDGASVEPYDEDGFVGQRISFSQVPLAEFSQGGLADTGEELSITREGDEFHVNGRLDMTSPEFGGGEVPGQALESIEFRIAITFPGPVRSATGEVDGNTVTWTPRVGQRTEIRAVASAIPSGSPLLTILLIVLGALVAAGTVVLVVSRRARPAPAPAAGSGFEALEAPPADAPAEDAPPGPFDAPPPPPSAAAPEPPQDGTPSTEEGPPPVPPVSG